jgi:hypothetical protein
LRLPADSLFPGHSPAQEASWETLANTLMFPPISAMITAATVLHAGDFLAPEDKVAIGT